MSSWAKRPRSPAYDRNRLVALRRDNYLCQLRLDGCTVRATQADHIVPHAKGGSDEAINLRAACASCNARANILTRAKAPPRRRPPEAHPGLVPPAAPEPPY